MIGAGRRDLLSVVVLLLAAIPLVGCGVSKGPRHEYTLLPGRAFDGRQKTALVVPVNETTPIPTGLEKGESLVSDLLRAYLQAKGLEVIEVRKRAFRPALDAAAGRADQAMLSGQSRSVARTVDFGQTIPYLAAELGVEPDLVVVPNMMMRTAEFIGGRTLRWDGVRRRLPGANGLIADEGGELSAVSIRVAVYDSEGERVFAGFGGLDLLFRVDRQTERYVLIEDRLEDADHLAEGICVAFHPFFGEDESC